MPVEGAGLNRKKPIGMYDQKCDHLCVGCKCFYPKVLAVTLIILIIMERNGLLPFRAMPEMEKTETVFRFPYI